MSGRLYISRRNDSAARRPDSPVGRQNRACMLRPGRFSLVIVLSLSLIGCSTTRPVTPDQTFTGSQQRIIVYLRDHRIITFDPGDYSIHGDSDSSYIQGSGRESIEGRPGERGFRGMIGRSEITQIRITEPTKLTKIMTPVALGLLLLTGLAIYGLATADWSE